MTSKEKMEWCRPETQHVPWKVQGLGEPGARITLESIFPFKLDINPCIDLGMNCATVCHARRDLVPLPSWERFPSQCSWSWCGEPSQGGPQRHPSVGVAVASWCWLGELQKHQGTARSCSCKCRWLFPVSQEEAGWLPKGLQTTSFPHPTQQPLA